MTLLPVAEATAADVGGKARGLARLVALGLPVPPALVLGPDAHARWREDGEVDRAALERALAELGEPVAVRSSAAGEDSGDRSAAGQYESVMGVRGLDALVAAVAECYRAADSDRARAYRGADGVSMALVLQREVAADRAGIGFSADPVTGATDDVLLEAVYGHGEGAVSGLVTPDRYRVAREGRTVRARVADKGRASDGRGGIRDLPAARRLARVLRDDEAQRVAGVVLQAERGFKRPVDVEFCFSGPELWLVQCRPITTVGR